MISNKLKFLYLLDFVSQGPELKIDYMKTKKSIFGVMLSSTIGAAIIFLFFYLGIDIINKQNPSLISIEQSLKTPEIKTLNNTNFVLGLKIVDFNINKLDFSKHISLTVFNENYYLRNKSESSSNDDESVWIYNEEIIDLSPCFDHKNYEIEEGINSPISSFDCPKNFSLLLGGSYSYIQNHIVSVYVDYCRNSTENGNMCASEEETNEFLSQGVYLVLYLRDFIIDPKDADNPINKVDSPTIMALSNSLSREFTINYKNLEVKTDFGFIFEEFEYKDNIKLFSKENQYIENSLKKRPLLYIILNLINQKLIYERKYLKIQELAASVGGVAKFLMVIGSFVIMNFNNLEINTIIMNELFDFIQADSKKENLRKKSNSNTIKLNEGEVKDISQLGIIHNNSDYNNNHNVRKLNFNNNINTSNAKNNINNSIIKNSIFETKNQIGNDANQGNINEIKIKGAKIKSNNNNNIGNNIDNRLSLNKIDNNINESSNINLNSKFASSKLKQIESHANIERNNKLGMSDDNLKNVSSLHNLSRNNQTIINKNNINFNLKGTRKHAELNFTFFQQVVFFICPIRRFRSSIVKRKMFQYDKCIDDVKEYMNINYIIKKIHDIEYIKTILFNKEQILSFNYFNKPLIDYESSSYTENRLINEVRELNKLKEQDHISMLSQYFEKLDPLKISSEDAKILSLLHIDN